MKTGRIAVAVGILCAALFLGHSFLLAQEKAVGKVVAMEGRASITRQGKNIPAALLAEIYPADTVVTARGSKLKILFIDDSILALGGRSKIIIEKFLYQGKEKKGEASFNLTLGKARALLGKAHLKDSLYEIKTPTAIAGVRGTHFIVWVVSARLTQILVLSGEVEVRDIAGIGKQVLKENFASRVTSGEAPGSAYTPEPEEVNRLQDETTVSSEIPEEELPVVPAAVTTEGTVEEKITNSTGSATGDGSTQQEVVDQPVNQALPCPPSTPSLCN